MTENDGSKGSEIRARQKEKARDPASPLILKNLISGGGVMMGRA
jgi:hypothetical protein